ncbi:MAG: transglycosylase domain-containing protein [Bdellovibrionota bacterium]|nr:MAG: transglycosylase domain-containing protein [Bdellovibrionota bacterium]
MDLVSILRAIKKNLETGSMRQGGSTITQQVVKNLLLTSERSLRRKAKEAILSYQLEKRLNKDGIFELYLNQIFFGNGAYGIKSAARSYFHKELAELTLAEAALLAGLPKAPSKYSPLTNLPAAKKRQGYVLDQMVKAQFITIEEAAQALAEEVKVYPFNAQNVYAAPYYVGEIRRVFYEHAAWRSLDLDSDGLIIHTAVD